MTFEAVLRFINVSAAGIAAGILVLVALAVVPALARLGDDATLRYKQAFDLHVDRINPAAVVASAVCGLLVLLVADDLSTTATAATIVGLIGSAGVGATSLGVNMRINREIASWSPDSPPAEFGQLMQRWKQSHAVRTLAGVIAFAGYLVGVLAAVD